MLVRPQRLMRLTRRRFLGGAAVAAVGGAGIYELVDQLTGAPARTTPSASATVPPPEQHVIDLGLVELDGIAVVVPPLHHEIVTATVKATDLVAAQHGLERALADLDDRYPLDASGLGVTVAWGLPYFERHVAEQAKAHLPFDHRAGKSALLPARRFPSDPHDTILEENDVAVLLRSDSRAHIDDARKALFDDLPLLPDDEHPPRLRGRRLRRQAEPPEEDGDGRRRARCRSHPRHVRAVPRLHVDAEGGPRPAPDRESRDARLRRPARRLLPRRHAHAPLAPRRGPRGVVPQLRLRRACAHDVPSRPDERQAGNADGGAGAEGRRDAGGDGSRVQQARDASATARRSRRPRGCSKTSSVPTAPSTRREPRSRSAPTSTRSTTPSPGAPRRTATR